MQREFTHPFDLPFDETREKIDYFPPWRRKVLARLRGKHRLRARIRSDTSYFLTRLTLSVVSPSCFDCSSSMKDEFNRFTSESIFDARLRGRSLFLDDQCLVAS